MIPYILNLLDLLFTLHALRWGGVELNPLMQNVPLMVAYKVIGVGALCWWLSRRTEKIARYGLRVCAAALAAVNIYHIYFIFGGTI